MIEQYVDVYLDEEQEHSAEVLVAFYYTHDEGYEVVTVTAEDGYVHHWSDLQPETKIQIYDGLEDNRMDNKSYPKLSGVECLKRYK